MTTQVSPQATSQSISAIAEPEYPTCCECGATGPQRFGWFKWNDGRALCGECRYPVPAGACADCRGAGRFTIGAQTDDLTGNAIAYACPTCGGSGKAQRLDAPELLAEMAADFAWLASRPNPMPDWQTFVGLTTRDANGTPMVWRDNGERSGYYPAGGAA